LATASRVGLSCELGAERRARQLAFVGHVASYTVDGTSRRRASRQPRRPSRTRPEPGAQESTVRRGPTPSVPGPGVVQRRRDHLWAVVSDRSSGARRQPVESGAIHANRTRSAGRKALVPEPRPPAARATKAPLTKAPQTRGFYLGCAMGLEPTTAWTTSSSADGGAAGWKAAVYRAFVALVPRAAGARVAADRRGLLAIRRDSGTRRT